MRKRIWLIAAAVMLLAALSACRTGSYEIDERAYVYTIGVDRGVTDKLRFTFQFPTLTAKQGQGEGGGGGESTKSETAKQLSTITVDCPTIYTGVTMLYSSHSRRLNFTHAKYLVISEELARESVEPFINSMTRSADIRRTMYVIVCKGRAMDFVNEFKPFAGASVSKSQELIMENAEQSALFESMTYNEFSNRLKCTKCQASATLAALNDFSDFKDSGEQEQAFKSEGDYYAGEVPRKSDNKFEFMGTAIFDGATMVGELNGNETRSMLMLRGDFIETHMVIPDPADPNLRIGAVVFQKRKPDIKIVFEDGKAKISAKVFLDAALQNVQSAESIEKEKKTPVEEAFERFVKEKLDQTVKKCQELNCEAFDFGYKASVQFWTIQDWEKYNWLSSFKNAEVTTEVEFVIRRTGTLVATEEEKRGETA